jgi:hypothetical protein
VRRFHLAQIPRDHTEFAARITTLLRDHRPALATPVLYLPGYQADTNDAATSSAFRKMFTP